MNKYVEILTPVGRMVQGDCFKPDTTDADGNPLTIKSGPNMGQPTQKYFVAIAIPKTDPGLPALIATINQVAQRDFPTLFNEQGQCLQPAFSFKQTDGDSQVPNKKNIRPCDREGFPGNWIFAWQVPSAPECYSAGGVSVLTEPGSIKRGHYIRIHGYATGNKSAQNPGVYLNPKMIELVAFGEEINSGPDGATVFGGAPVGALPPGASATPIAGAPLAMPAQAGAAPVAALGTPGQAPAAVQPAHDFVTAAAVAPAPPAAGPPAPVAAAPEATYRTPDGGAWTHAQLIAAKYTPEQIGKLPRA